MKIEVNGRGLRITAEHGHITLNEQEKKELIQIVQRDYVVKDIEENAERTLQKLKVKSK